jgi:hypothetical protein
LNKDSIFGKVCGHHDKKEEIPPKTILLDYYRAIEVKKLENLEKDKVAMGRLQGIVEIVEVAGIVELVIEKGNRVQALVMGIAEHVELADIAEHVEQVRIAEIFELVGIVDSEVPVGIVDLELVGLAEGEAVDKEIVEPVDIDLKDEGLNSEGAYSEQTLA